MNISDLEKAIIQEVRVVTKTYRLRLKDLKEWSTAEIKPQEGKKVVFLPVLKVWAVYSNYDKTI